MAVFNEPNQWEHPLGNNADTSTLPDDAAATAGTASLQKLFQLINATPLEAGGIAPDREDVNALFKYLGDQIFYTQNGGIPSYNAAYDYIPGRVVLYTDNNIYKCIQTNGASSTVVAPGTDDTYWKQLDGEDDSTSLIPNQLIVSPVPLTDANLHLLDGALLSGSGTYADYVTMMSELYTADPTANIWTDEATWQASVTNTGSCGKFVYDSVNNTLRLPKYDARYLKSTLSASDLGDLVEAGAPNITGGNNSYVIGTNAATQYGALFNSSSSSVGGIQGTYYASHQICLDASRSSSVYKDSATTIDTDAIKVYYYIVLGTISKTQIQIDIDNVMADLAQKADTDLSNATPTSAFATAMNSANIRTVVETYVSGSSWYRVWSDGFCEQGGITAGAGAAYETVTLLKPFRDTNYSALCAPYIGSINNSTSIGIGAKTTTTCQFTCGSHAFQLIWECKGYIS